MASTEVTSVTSFGNKQFFTAMTRVVKLVHTAIACSVSESYDKIKINMKELQIKIRFVMHCDFFKIRFTLFMMKLIFNFYYTYVFILKYVTLIMYYLLIPTYFNLFYFYFIPIKLT